MDFNLSERLDSMQLPEDIHVGMGFKSSKKF